MKTYKCGCVVVIETKDCSSSFCMGRCSRCENYLPILREVVMCYKCKVRKAKELENIHKF